MSERRLLNLPSCGILVGLAVSLGACDVAIDSGTAIYTVDVATGALRRLSRR